MTSLAGGGEMLAFFCLPQALLAPQRVHPHSVCPILSMLGLPGPLRDCLHATDIIFTVSLRASGRSWRRCPWFGWAHSLWCARAHAELHLAYTRRFLCHCPMDRSAGGNTKRGPVPWMLPPPRRIPGITESIHGCRADLNLSNFPLAQECRSRAKKYTGAGKAAVRGRPC